MSDYLLIDANSVGHTCAHSKVKGLDFDPGQARQLILKEMFDRILDQIKLNENACPILLWDSASLWRNALYPQYKEGRSSTGSEVQLKVRALYKSMAQDLEAFFAACAIPSLKAEGFEADDLAHFLIQTQAYESLRLYTNDTDWFQGLRSDKVVWCSVRRDSRASLGEFTASNEELVTARDLFGEGKPFRNVQQFLEHKAIVGDSSDNIEGFYKIGEKTALKILNEFESFEQFLNHCQTLEKKPKAFEVFEPAAKALELFRLNMKLIDWREAPYFKADNGCLFSGLALDPKGVLRHNPDKAVLTRVLALKKRHAQWAAQAKALISSL